MALKLRHPGIEPLGEFDLLDSETTSIVGGEIGTFDGTLRDEAGGTDLHAFDADGYVEGAFPFRTVVRRANDTDVGPFLILDDGISGYGTLFGTLVGSVAGKVIGNPVTGAGTLLGPTTISGSGKVTGWDKPGTYMVTTDVLCATNPPTAATAPGTALYSGATGLWTLTVGGAVVGRFIEWNNGDSLVNTPADLVKGTYTITYMVVEKV